ncbi:MAG: hypothetical protein ACOY94_14895 [Bacillota bacterium]
MRYFALLLLLLLAGCSRPPDPVGPSLPKGWPAAPDAIIFQSHARGGYISPSWRLAQVPDLTVLADGRVLYRERNEAGEAAYFVGQIPAKELPVVYEQAARGMSGLSGHYEAGVWTDDATTRFSLWLPSGTQSLTVYGFSPTPQETEQEGAVLERLRSVLAAILGAMEPSRSPYIVADLTLVVEEGDHAFRPWPSKDWPAVLPALPAIPPGERAASARLTGEEARAVSASIPFDSPRLYRQGEMHYRVFAVPAIPLMP